MTIAHGERHVVLTRRLPDIESEQLRLIEEGRLYLESCSSNGVDVAESELCRLAAWAPGPSRNVLDSFRGRPFSLKRKLLCLLEAALKPTYRLVSADGPAGSTSDLVVVSWVSRKDFADDGFHDDRYFGVSSRDDLSVNWVLLSVDGFVPARVAENVRIVVSKRRSVLARLRQLGRVLTIVAASRGLERDHGMHAMSALGSPSRIMARTIESSLASDAAEFGVLIAYEAQCYQHGIVQRLKSKLPSVQVTGYLHSALPALPTDFLHRDGAPDVLLVNGSGQAHILLKHLGWPAGSVVAIEALRYQEGSLVPEAGEIFLPYTLTPDNNWLAVLSAYLEAQRPASLAPLVVRNHPYMFDSPEHLRLTRELDSLLVRYSNRFSDGHAARHLSILFGASAAGLECVEAGIELVQFSNDPVTEVRTHCLWDELQVRSVVDDAFEYDLLRPNAYIRRGQAGRKLRDVLVDSELRALTAARREIRESA